jgi:RNA polymerase sigma-70 factor (ECF subfamily)
MDAVATTAVSLLAQLREPQSATAWRRFVDLYSPLLYRWVRRCGVQPADAADLIQEVLLAVYHHLPAFERRRRGSFRAWLRTIAVNKVRAVRRRQVPVALESELAADFAGWDEEYAAGLLARVLELTEPEFEPLTWQAFRRVQFDGQPASAVAVELGVSRNAVYIARSRVLRRLREQVEHLLA